MHKKVLLFFLISTLALSSCRVFNPSVMMRTDRDFEFATPPDSVDLEYRINVDDRLNFRMFANDGFKIIDITSFDRYNGGSVSFTAENNLQYTVEFDGLVRFPILGRIKLVGLTLREAEALLEQKYSEYYNKPFVLLSVSNKRVVVYSGGRTGNATVVPLLNENISIIEALALAGGVGNEGKSHKVKLVRGDLNNPDVYQFDLSTMEGTMAASMVVFPGDIIYVQPRWRISDQVLDDASRVIGVISSSVLTYFLVRSL